MPISLGDSNRARILVDSEASITAQLKGGAAGAVLANVIQEGWRRPNHVEQKALCAYDDSTSHLAWVREVLLYTGKSCRALARILVPADQVGFIPWVLHLGEQPFGEVLFSVYSPKRERVCREASRFNDASRHFSLRARQVALRAGFAKHEQYWGRTSVLVVPGEQNFHCFVTEFFL